MLTAWLRRRLCADEAVKVMTMTVDFDLLLDKNKMNEKTFGCDCDVVVLLLLPTVLKAVKTQS